MPKSLTPLRERFVREFLVDLNATAAAGRAGSKAKDLKSAGHELLTFPDVRSRVKELMRKRSARLAVKASEIVRSIDEVADSDIGEVFDFSRPGAPVLRDADLIPVRARRSIRSLKVKTVTYGTGKDQVTKTETEVTLWSKTDAQRLAGLHRGLFLPDADPEAQDAGPPPVIRIELVDGDQPAED